MRHWRAALAGTLATCAVVVVVVAALFADGRVGSESLTNDGGAWLLNRSEGSIGHVNRAASEVDATVGPFSGAFDVSQSEGLVVVNDRGGSRAVLVDTALQEAGAPVTITPAIQVTATPGAIVLNDAEVGAIWRFAKEQFGTVQTLSDEPALVQSSPGALVVVGRGGHVMVADEFASTVTMIDTAGLVEEFVVEEWTSGTPVGVTFVGDVGVVALDDGTALVVEGDGPRRVSLAAEIVKLQQPSVAGLSFVGLTATNELVTVDLESGAELGREAISGGNPLDPIVHNSCVWTLTMTPSPVLHHCGLASPLPQSGGELKLVLVNGWVWVNDVNQGDIYLVREDEVEVEQIDDWTAALDITDAEDQDDDSAGGEEDFVENANADELAEDVDELDEDDRNTPPVAEDDAAQTRRGRPVVIQVLRNDVDEDNDPLAVESLIDVDSEGSTASGAIVSITPDGSAVQVVPPEDFIGELRFGYVVHDGRQGRDDATVRLDIAAPDEATNRPPITEDDNATVRAGKSVALNVLNNDIDPDGDVLVLLSVDDLEGAVNFGPDGEVAYTPDVTSAEGTIDLGYVVADDYGAEGSGTIRIRVRRADSNQAPQARNDVGKTSVNRPVFLNVLANDMDPDGDPLSVQNLQAVDSPVTTAQLTPDGSFLFRPEAAGTYRFTYTVSDGPEVDQAQIRIDVDEVEVNRPPVAVVDKVALAIGESRLVRVLENDGDPDGDVVGIVEWIGAPGLEINEVPGIGFNVLATPTAEPRTTFRYWISDGTAAPVRGDVIVSALRREPVDYPPVAVADTVDVRAGQTTELSVLRNDYDPEGKFLRLVRPLPNLTEGLLRMTPDRQTLLLTVDPAQQFSFQFTYDVQDPAGNRSSTVVNVRIVNINQPNRAPVAGPDVARTPSETPVVIPVRANDFDPDGDPITVESIAEQPQHGSVRILEDDTIVYTPNQGFAGTDSFVYTLVDGYQAPVDSKFPPDQRGPGRDLGEVYVGVMPAEAANRPPTAVDDLGFPSVKIGTDSVVLNVLANDSDPDSDPLVVTEVTGPSVGEARVGANGRSVEFTPPAEGENRDVAFSYSIADGRGGTASAQVILELVAEPVPIPPEAADDTVGPVKPGQEIVFDPRENDVDPDGDASELVVVPESVLMTVEPDGRVRLVAPDVTSDVGYRVRDPQGLESEVAFVTVLVAENETPTVEPIAVETKYNEPVVIDLHDAVNDPDGDPLVITLGKNRSGGSVAVVGQPTDSFLQVRFTPDSDFEGVASFDFVVDDRFGHVVAGGVTVTVLPPENRAPETRPISIDAEAGVPAPVNLATAVTDPDPDGAANHTYAISGSARGNVTLVGPTREGVVTIRSDVDGGGVTDSFTYTVTDGDFTATNTVSINLAVPAFAPPSLTDDTARVLQGVATAPIGLLTNDVDNSPASLRGAGLTVTAVGVTPAGEVRQSGDSVVFTPNPEFFGQASFTYTVQDGRRSAEGQSTGIVTVDVIGRPGQPQPPTIDTVGNGYLIVSWRSPQGDAARAPVSGYVLEFVADNGDTGSIKFDTPKTNHRWAGLTNAVGYCFRVAAANEAGVGDFSADSQCKAPDVRPERPSVPTVDFGDTKLTIKWSPPLNQGSDILNYQLRVSGGTQSLSPELGVTTSYTWNGLKNGTDYTFEVRAQNSATTDNDGWSDWSDLSAPEHPLTLPDAPGQPQAVRGDRQVQITWNAPYNGGDTITLYQVRSSINPTWVNVTPQGATNTHTWQDIPNGTNVSFQIRAVNRDPRSTTPGNVSPQSPVVRTCSVPDAPGKPTVTRGDTQVQVAWSTPNAQGCAISEYRITSSAGGTQTASASATSHNFTGLTNGTVYTFTVAAINEVVTVDGRSPVASPASDAVTPAGPPFATNVTEATNVAVRQVRVSWAPPNNNGSPITNYQIQVNGGAWTDVGNVTTVTRTEASNGATYTYRVRAVNSVGPSTQTGAAQSATTWNIPGTPSVSASSNGDRQIRGTWNNPSNGGTGFNGQQTQLTTGSCTSGSNVGVGTTSQTWGSLSYSTTYRVCVRYSNAVGWGPWGSATARTQAQTWSLTNSSVDRTCAEPDFSAPSQWSNGNCSGQTGSSTWVAAWATVGVSCYTDQPGWSSGGVIRWYRMTTYFPGYYINGDGLTGSTSGLPAC